MIRVQFCTRYHPRLFLRQTPNQDGIWRGLSFILDDGACNADWLVVFDEPKETIHTCVPRERRILFVTEPPSAKTYTPDYLEQFGVAVSPMALLGFKGRWLQRHGSLSWHFGCGWDKQNPNWERESIPFSTLSTATYEKPLELSVICSTKTKLADHRRRMDFVHALKDLLGDRLHWYGRGVRDIGDKAEAIAPYRYHIVLENNFVDHFWTEKIADCYLGLAFPFYAGCANLHDYFDSAAFEYIRLDDVRGAAKTIETAIAGRFFETRFAHLQESRRKVLFEYNFFNEVRSVVVKLQTGFGAHSLLTCPEAIHRMATPREQRHRQKQAVRAERERRRLQKQALRDEREIRRRQQRTSDSCATSATFRFGVVWQQLLRRLCRRTAVRSERKS